LRQIALLEIGAVDLGAHLDGTHLSVEAIEADPGGEAERVKRAVDEAGLAIADFFPTFGHGFRDRPVNAPDPATQEANRRRFAALVEFCRLVGCPGITLLPGVIWDELGPRSVIRAGDRGSDGVRGDRARGRLRVSIEPHLESVVEEPERALALVEAVPGTAIHPRLQPFRRGRGCRPSGSTRSSRTPGIFTRARPRRASCKRFAARGRSISRISSAACSPPGMTAT
jgi:hypothetical protein